MRQKARLVRSPDGIIVAYSNTPLPFVGRQQVTINIPKNQAMSEFDFITNDFTNAIGIIPQKKTVRRDQQTTTTQAPRSTTTTTTAPIPRPRTQTVTRGGAPVPPTMTPIPIIAPPPIVTAPPIMGGGDMGGGGAGGGAGAPTPEEGAPAGEAVREGGWQANIKYIIAFAAGAGGGYYLAKNRGWNVWGVALAGGAVVAGGTWYYFNKIRKAPAPAPKPPSK